MIDEHQVGIVAVELAHKQPPSIAGHAEASSQRGRRTRKVADQLTSGTVETVDLVRLIGRSWN